MDRPRFAKAVLLAASTWLAGEAGLAQPTPAAGTAPHMATSLPEVKQALLKATGYDGESVEVTAGTYMLTVTVINSRVPNSIAREAEAHKIAATVALAIATKPEFRAIQAFHIDYVVREAGEDEFHIVDGIDFWKDRLGNFKLHTT
jgi:hypothetical protein